jgi:hypothetical protein
VTDCGWNIVALDPELDVESGDVRRAVASSDQQIGGDAGRHPETTMRKILFAASTVTLTTLSAVQFASAAATIPDNQARVNTRSAQAGDAVRNANAAVDVSVQATRPARAQFFAIPARR